MALRPTNVPSREEKKAKREEAAQQELLREVDEAVRKGDLEEFSQKWGRPLVALFVIGLLAFGGYLFWESRQEAQLEKNSEALVGALDQLQAGNLDTAFDNLAALAANGDALSAVNARMLRAGIAAQQGRTEEAAGIFGEVAADESAPPAIRDLAKVREISLRFDTMKPADIVAALSPIAVPGRALFPSAGELLAHAYLRQGQEAKAGEIFAQIAKDDRAPDSLRSRTRQMAGVLGVDAIEDVDAVLEDAALDEAGVAIDQSTEAGAPASAAE